jgi:hypothetical protein
VGEGFEHSGGRVFVSRQACWRSFIRWRKVPGRRICRTSRVV